MNLIGFTGVSGAGKDTAAQALVERGWTRLAFADAVRDALLALDPVVCLRCQDEITFVFQQLSFVVNRDGWDVAKKHYDIRRLLQRMGTEAGRAIHGVDCWIRIVAGKAIAIKAPVVVTDVRFANEAGWIKFCEGLVIGIRRPNVGPLNEHASENEPIPVDHWIDNDGSIDDLHRKVLELVTKGA